MRRRGYALTMILLAFSVVMAILYSGIFDAAKPRIEKATENTVKISEGLTDIKDAANTLWIKGLLPADKVMTPAEFSRLVGRDLSLTFFDGVKDLKIETVGFPGGVNVFVVCELQEYVEIYPYKLPSGAVYKDGVVKVMFSYRKGVVQ